MFDTLFSLEHTIASSILEGESLPYMALCRIEGFIRELIPSLGDEYDITDDGIAIHRSAVVSPSAVLLPPLIISEGAELRTGAFIRGSVIIGRGAVVGNSVEVKNSILFDEVEVPHLSYIGDSILGYKAHFGAGAMTSNVRADKRSVRIHMPDGTIDTGLLKMGALVGDCAEVGCNAVLNPGTVIGQHSNVYPLTSVRTAVPPFSICKADGTIIRKRM